MSYVVPERFRVISEKVFGTPYECMTPAQREEWEVLVREYGYRICETCGGRTGDYCYVNDLVGMTEVRRKRPKKVQRQDWCNGWTSEHVKPWPW